MKLNKSEIISVRLFICLNLSKCWTIEKPNPLYNSLPHITLFVHTVKHPTLLLLFFHYLLQLISSFVDISSIAPSSCEFWERILICTYTSPYSKGRWQRVGQKVKWLNSTLEAWMCFVFHHKLTVWLQGVKYCSLYIFDTLLQGRIMKLYLINS